MRESSPRGWHRWRVTFRSTPPAAFDRMMRLSPAPDPQPVSVSADGGAEAKRSDGIRHELVARVRQQIADGTYDTEERWLLAEEALLRRICD
jgi:hypothetical protein